MPLAAYSYPYPPYSSAGSGVNNLHPAPPALADGICYPPPATYPCEYPPQYATPAPSYCCPHVDHRLHHSGALLQSMHPHYPHLHCCPGLPCCSLPPDGLPTYSIAAPDNVDGRGAHGKLPHGPAFAFDSFPNPRSPQLFYPPMLATPLRTPDARPSRDEDVVTEVKAGLQGYVPSHSLVPFDKVPGANPNILYGDTAQWRGFPVTWKGNAPFALVPLSNVDGEQNLFVPKKVSTQFAPEGPQKNASAYMDWPLPARNLPIMWKQPGLIPAATHEDGKEKLNGKESLNDEDSKMTLNGKDPLNEVVSESKPLPVVWDGKSPLILLPAIHEAGKESSSFTPFKLMPMTKEVGQELSKVQPQAIIPADKGRQQASDKPLTKSALVTALNEDEKEPRELEKGKAFMPKNEGPIKVIPVVQLPAIDSSKQKEVPVQKVSPNDVGQGKAGIDHILSQPQTWQQSGKMPSQAQHASKQDCKGLSKDPPVQKKSFPAIKLVPPSDAKRCKSPRKSVTALQEKPAVLRTQGVESFQHGCQAGVLIPTLKDASLHAKDSGSNSSDVEAAPSVNANVGEAASHKAAECKLASRTNADGRATEEAVSSNYDKQRFNDIKVVSVASMEAAHGLCDGKRFLAPSVSESEKTQVKMMSQDSAAKCIQAVYRGYCVRKSQPLSQLRIIKEVQASYPDIFKQLDSKAEALKEPMERRKFSECVMALLFKLDTVQGRLLFVREQRKSLAKELSRVLETLDNIEQENVFFLSTPETVNEIVKEQEEASLSTPKAVKELAKGQGEMFSQTQDNISTDSGVDQEKPVAFDPCGNLKEHMHPCETVTEHRCQCDPEKRGEEERKEDLGLEVPLKVADMVEEGVTVLCEAPLPDSTREEKLEAGIESDASELPPAVLQLESMDEDSGVHQEKPVAFVSCGNLKEHIHPFQSATEQQRQCDPEKRGEEEKKEDPGLEVPLKVADMVEEGVAVFCEAPFSDADAVIPTCLIFDAGRDDKMGNQDATGALAKSPPSTSQVKEEMSEIAKTGRDDFDDALHLADMKQADQLDERTKGEPGDADKVVEELKEDAIVSSSPMKIKGTEVMKHTEPRLGDPDFENSVQSQQLDVTTAEEDAFVPSASSKIIGEEVMEHTKPRLRCHDSEGSVQSEQLNVPFTEESNKENEVSIPEDHIQGDISTASEVAVDESRVGSLGSNEGASEMGVKDEGQNAAAQQILQDNEGENATALQNLQDMLHEEYTSNGPHRDEAVVALTRREKLVDGQYVEERESNFSGDAAEVLKVADRDDILLHGDAKVEQPLLLDDLVVGNIDDGKTETKKDVSVDSPVSMMLASIMALDAQSNDGTDAENILAVKCPSKEVDDGELEDGSMLAAPLNRCSCDSDKEACCAQELVDVIPTKMDEEVNSVQMEKSEVSLEDIAIESCTHDAEIEANSCLEESEPKVLFNAMDESENQISARSEAGNMQKECVEKLAVESKNLMAVVEKLTEWNQQQANLIMQLSERMSRLEESWKASNHTLHSRKGRRRRRKINVNI